MTDTPIKQFVVKGLDLFIEDMLGKRTYLCSAADEIFVEWLANTVKAYHCCPLVYED